MNYSYDPSQINDRALNQMRFELGDCLTLEPEKSAYLGDEEITAAIDGSRSWRRAKLRLVETLLRRFSYEVDTKIKEADWKLHQRVDEWEKLYNRLKAEVEAEELSTLTGFTSRKQRPPIFTIGMHDWRRPCI